MKSQKNSMSMLIFGVLFVSAACVSSPTKSVNQVSEVKLRRIEFSELSRLKPGEDDRFSVVQKFGEPLSKENSTSLPTMEFWTYADTQGPQTLRMIFFPSTGKLKSFAYYPDENSELADRNIFLKKYFLGLRLVEEPRKGFQGRHYIDPYRYYRDDSKGVQLETDETGKKIRDITFFEPKPTQKRIVGSEIKK